MQQDVSIKQLIGGNYHRQDAAEPSPAHAVIRVSLSAEAGGGGGAGSGRKTQPVRREPTAHLEQEATHSQGAREDVSQHVSRNEG